MGNIVTVTFEFTDAYMSIVDDGSAIAEVESNCEKLCEVFNFDYERVRINPEGTPQLVFRVSFCKDILTQTHYLNVLQAFAHEFQVNISAAHEAE